MAELRQVVVLLILAIPVAWAAWTVTHEEVFRELQDYCTSRSKTCRRWAQRKFFYLFTCEYCFAHWCAFFFQLVFQLQMVFDDWRGYLVSFPALVWTANVYMNLYHRTRVDIRHQRALADQTEADSDRSQAA